MKTGIELIAEERDRQLLKHGWSAQHDDGHSHGELANAAAAYILQTLIGAFPIGKPPQMWPWDNDYWKPSASPRHNLAKAGALIAAELDRLQRLNERAERTKP